MTSQDRAEVSPKNTSRAASNAASKESTRKAAVIVEVIAPPTPVQHHAQARHGNVTSELIRELTRRERLVLMLRYTEELTVLEIAAVLEIATTEVERMLESIAERVRRKLTPVYSRPIPRLV